MKRWKSWFNLSYGIKLKKLHTWNGIVITLLAVTGLMLYFPSLRGKIAFMRTVLKDFHIFLGILSIIILFFYIPLIGHHLKQLKRKLNQQFNLWLILFFIVGWGVSGMILWQYRNLPSEWSVTALFFHDLFTWVGIPWAIFHSITRTRWLKEGKKQKERRIITLEESNIEVVSPQALPTDQVVAVDQEETANEMINWLKNPPYSRRKFMRWITGLIIVLSLSPSFYRWLKSSFDTGGTTIDTVSKSDGNRMLPNPKPLPASNPPIGGGSQGNFRVYTVTNIPSFSSDNWKFAVGGLVTNTIALSWEELLKIHRKVQASDFHCVTGWSVYHVTWEGIPLTQLLDYVGVNPKAKYVKFYSGDGVYTDSLSLEQARMKDVMVAIMMDGKPIPQKLGGPVRLIVPKMYAYKSVKWLQAIELIEKEHIGYWEARGYDSDAWVPGLS